MKAKLMAVLLAVGLGVTGVAVTAQAAEVGTHAVNDCSHSTYVEYTIRTSVIKWNGDYHYSSYKTEYICTKCDYRVKEPDYRGEYEPHDYEQVYLDNGQVMSYCTACGEYYFW